MRLFDEQIRQALYLPDARALKSFGYHPERAAPETDPNELVLKRDMAFELGEGSFPAVGFTAITQDKALLPEDGVFLWGPDLHEIKEDGPFARITIVRTDDIYEKGDQAAYNLITNLETEKFRIAPAGYMMRPAAMSNREQVRVSRKAIQDGLRFSHVGNLMIQKYHQNRHVRAVSVLFITQPDQLYRSLDQLATRVSEIAKTLNHALLEVSMNCRACEWKPVCDTVDGIKALHQEQIRQKEETMR